MKRIIVDLTAAGEVSSLTRQSLPDDEYIYYLGVALSVFISNNAFMVENIIHTNPDSDWYKLIDDTSRKICDKFENVTHGSCPEITELFGDIIDMRDRIVHGFRVTSKTNEQIMATKKKRPDNTQKEITKERLLEFIRKNERLAILLNDYRESLRG